MIPPCFSSAKRRKNFFAEKNPYRNTKIRHRTSLFFSNFGGRGIILQFPLIQVLKMVSFFLYFFERTFVQTQERGLLATDFLFWIDRKRKKPYLFVDFVSQSVLKLKMILSEFVKRAAFLFLEKTIKNNFVLCVVELEQKFLATYLKEQNNSRISNVNKFWFVVWNKWGN